MSQFSKFFGGNDASSSEEESSSNEEQTQQQQNAAQKKMATYLRDSSDSEQEERTIKSGKTKRLEALEKIADEIRKHSNILDFNALDNDFTKLQDLIKKQAATLFPNKDETIPVMLLKVFAMIDNTINGVTSEQKKKMNKVNSVSYNKLKQKFKKYLQSEGEGDELFEKQLQKYQENPPSESESEDEDSSEEESDEEEEEEEEEESEEESEEEKKEAPKKKEEPKKKVEDSEPESEEEGDEEEEDEYYDEEDEDAEEEDSDDDKVDTTDVDASLLTGKYAFLFKPREEMTPQQRRWKWVKKECLPIEIRNILERKPKKEKGERKERERKVGAGDEEGAEFITEIRTRDDMTLDYSQSHIVIERLPILKQERLKGRYDPDYHVNVLDRMAEMQKDDKLQVSILLDLIAVKFSSSKGFLDLAAWNFTANKLSQLLDIISTDDFKKHVQSTLKSEKKEMNTQEKILLEGVKSIFPSLANFIESLESHQYRAFKSVQHTSLDYLHLIKNENLMLFINDKALNFVDSFSHPDLLSRIAMVKINYIYYKKDNIYQDIKAKLADKPDQLKTTYFLDNSEQEIVRLVSLVHKAGRPAIKVRATLCQIYHHALHNRVIQAKDLLLKTHIQKIIGLQIVDNQVIYNRAITQIGLAFFRSGRIEEAHESLVDICQHQRHRELLAQGLMKLQEKPIEFEIEELKRQVPFHMHIDLQTLETVYLTSAMLLEIPNIAENQYSMKKQVISKKFKYLVESYDEKAFHLAAENYKDQIVQASLALNKSNWCSVRDSLFEIKQIKGLPEFQNGNLKDLLIQRIKQASLKTFMCKGAKSYQTFSLKSLANIFEMEENQVKKFISKMILRNQIDAHIEPRLQVVVLDKNASDIKELQQLSLQYVAKIEQQIANNERMLDYMINPHKYAQQTQAAQRK